jgi:hypothetical protein
MKIEKLTAEQKALLPVMAQKWINSIGQKYNKSDIEEGIEFLYSTSGLKKPKIVHVSSPLGLQHGANIFKVWDEVGKEVGNEVGKEVGNKVGNEVGKEVWNKVWKEVAKEVWNEVANEVGNEVWKEVWNEVRNEVRNKVWDEVRNKVWDEVGKEVGNEVGKEVGNKVWNEVGKEVWNEVGKEVWNKVWNEVANEVRNEVRKEVGKEVGNEVGKEVWNKVWKEVAKEVWNEVANEVGNEVWKEVWNKVGDEVGKEVWDEVGNKVGDEVGKSKLEFYSFAHRGTIYDYDWLAWVEFYQSLFEFKNEFQIEKLKKLSSCFFMLQFENLAIACEHPIKLNRDDRGRLHSETEAAIAWRDGYAQYYVNGIAVTEKIIKSPELITIEEINSEKNLEKQRIMINRFGTDRYLIESGAKLIDADLSSRKGARALMEDNQGLRWLVCTDGSTDRVYYLAAPNNSKTCKDAHEALCGFSEDRIVLEG